MSRACGDGSVYKGGKTLHNKYVPRLRGWFVNQDNHKIITVVCPALAGMIRKTG